MTDKTTKRLLGFYGFLRRIFNPFKFPTTELWKSKVNLPLGAFVNEVIDTIKLEPLRDRLHHLVEKRFRGELSKCEGCKLCK